jgi:hypothetical protein
MNASYEPPGRIRERRRSRGRAVPYRPEVNAFWMAEWERRYAKRWRHVRQHGRDLLLPAGAR